MPRRGENIRKRSDGRWEARYIKDYSPDGKAKYAYVYAKTYAEVKEKKTKAQVCSSSGNLITLTNSKFLGEVMIEWLLLQKNVVKKSTYALYDTIISNHLYPSLGKHRLKYLDSRHIDAYINEKLTSGRIDKKGGLSPKTVIDQLAVLKLILNYAEDKKWLSRGSIHYHIPKKEQHDVKTISIREQKKIEKWIMNNLEGTGVGVLLSLYTGIRIGEVCALRFSDINMSESILSVKSTIIRIKDTEPNAKHKTRVIIDAPKTLKSIRSIPIPSCIMTILRTMRSRVYDSNAFILTGTNKYIEPRAYYKKYKKLLEDCNANDYTFHALRHTFATRCIESGFDAKSLSEILGHADIRITLERYVHPSMELKRNHMEKLAAMH